MFLSLAHIMLFVSELMDIMLAGENQSQADQPNSLAEGPPVRHSTTQKTGTANPVRQPHQLHAKQCHVHLIEIKYCEDTRPQHQLTRLCSSMQTFGGSGLRNSQEHPARFLVNQPMAGHRQPTGNL
eukprot:1161416-Pelagomonas_calceolata.AAC.4